MRRSADELARTVLCAMPGCDNELGHKRGRGLAAYCDSCKGTRADELAEARLISFAKRGSGRYASRARGLVVFAAAVDVAEAHRARADLELEVRRREYRAALRALCAAEGL